MKKETEVYLEDILNCIEKIEEYTSGMDFDTFSEDIKTQDAVIRNFEVIGEATNRIPDEFFTKTQSFPAKEAVAMRNFLIHDYDEIEIDVIWKTLKNDIPHLKEQVHSVLNK